MDKARECPLCGKPVTIVTKGRLATWVCEEGSSCRGSGLATCALASDLDRAITAWNTRTHVVSEEMVEIAGRVIYDALEERFPGGCLPGGRQLFAADDIDANFAHERGCDDLARAALTAALSPSNTGEG